MKNAIKLFLMSMLTACTVVLSTVASTGGNDAEIKIENLTGLRVKVSYQNAVDKKAILRLVDQNGNYLFEEPVTSNYAKVFNFSALSDGDIQLVVSIGNERITRMINIATRSERVTNIIAKN